MKPISSSIPALVVATFCAAALLANSTARAQVAFDIHVNTLALVGHPSGPFFLDFQLNDGSGLGNGNNTATLGLFDFHGGSALPGTNTVGGATGNLTSTVTLTDTAFINEFFQAFTPGASLDFRLSLTTFVEAPTPDLFAFSILDRDLFSLPTFSTSDAFLVIDIVSRNPAVESFGGNPAAAGIAIAAPAFVAVPEPASYGVIAALGVAGVGLWKRRRAAA